MKNRVDIALKLKYVPSGVRPEEVRAQGISKTLDEEDVEALESQLIVFYHYDLDKALAKSFLHDKGN
ncbi:Hypothetical protein FKW44_005147 [Caligus rogercresseyi]|uniref:Uncharacterized protein n=1 Tax=Caligus rogercresseyi TaxID=217165 RepID=A0A7T8KBJ6_CALRO|nr:Hypothetical protein FKW44_005147 [Caligus rogercresseyi]